MKDLYLMQKAVLSAQTALEAGEFPVGCVIGCNGDLVVEGARQGTSRKSKNELDHAEIVALRRLSELDTPIDPGSVTLYSTLEPCMMCFGAILIHGIRRIVYAYEDVMGGATGLDLGTASPLYRDSGMVIKKHVMRNESLKLFQAYFANPDNDYWENSLLARYTLEQKIKDD